MKSENKKPVRLPSTPTLPERPRTNSRQGLDHRHKSSMRPLFKQRPAQLEAGRVQKEPSTVGQVEDVNQRTTWMGSVAPSMNTKEGDYSGSISMKQDRHEEMGGIWGREEGNT